MADVPAVEETEAAPKPVSVAAWKKAAVHSITLDSGAVVEIKIPDLPALIEAGEIPNPLVETVLKSVKHAQRGGDPEVSRDIIQKQADFTNLIVRISVVNPKLTDADVKDIPVEDRELIASIATRVRDFDAIGHHIGRLDKIDSFRAFRDLDG